MTKLKPRYRFTRIFRGFQIGDMVPEAFDEGTIGTMLSVNKIERVPENAPTTDPALEEEAWNEPAPTIAQAKAKVEAKKAAVVWKETATEEDDEDNLKQVISPPADKMVKPNRKWVKRK